MTAGWLLANDTEHMTAAVFVITSVSSLSSYQAELEGTFRLLKHIEYLNMSPDEIRHWCDNEGAVSATNTTTIHTPGGMLAPDADIILAILHHKRKTGIQSECKHVLSHQDTKKKKSKEDKEQEKKVKLRERRARIREVDVGEGTHAPSPEPSPPSSPVSQGNDSSMLPNSPAPRREIDPKDLSDEALMNMACDDYAGEAAREHMECPKAPPPNVLQPPYEGSKAMLKIGDLWITSDFDRNIHFASTAKDLRSYCRTRHKWSKKVFNLVDWKMIDSVRRTYKWHDFVRSMKLLHGWLPIMHNLGKQTHITQCPGCVCSDETFLHLFQCSHHLMKQAVHGAIEKITDTCSAMRLNSTFTKAFISCITNGILETHAPVPSSPHELATAVKHQNSIGTHKMLQGFLASSWSAALKATGHKKHQQSLRRLHVFLYDLLFQRIWDTRNFILKKTPNQYNKVADMSLTQRLIWYKENRHTMLSLSDCHLANFDEETIRQMGRDTKRKWIKTL
jgi:hypothetical protein